MKSAISTLFALCLTIFAVSAQELRDPGDHTRNTIMFFIGFAIGLAVFLTGLCCWKYFETFDLCQRAIKDKQYSPPPETGADA